MSPSRSGPRGSRFIRPVRPGYSVNQRPNIGADGRPIPSSAPMRRTVTEPRDIRLNESAQGSRRQVILGKVLDGARWIFAQSYSTGQILYLIAGHGHGPVKSITPRIDGAALTWDAGNSRWTAGSGNVLVWTFDGSQAALTGTGLDLATLDPTAAAEEVHTGEALSVIRLNYAPPDWTTLPKFTFLIEGLDTLEDPRGGAPAYCTNPVVFLWNYLKNTTWGLGVDPDNLDSPSFEAAADYADQDIFTTTPTGTITSSVGSSGNPNGTYVWAFTCLNAAGVETLLGPVSAQRSLTSQRANLTVPTGDGLTASRNVYRRNEATPQNGFRLVGSIPNNTGTTLEDNVSNATWATNAAAPTVAPLSTFRYYAGLSINREADGEDWLKTIAAHFFGLVREVSGVWSVLVDCPLPGGYTPAQFQVDEPGGNIIPQTFRAWRKERALLPNQVKVNYTDAQGSWNRVSVTKSRPGVGTTEPVREVTLELFGLQDAAIAGRMATQYLNRAWDDYMVEFQAGPEGLGVEPWDVIEVSGGGLSAQEFRVNSATVRGGTVSIQATEYHAASYTDSAVLAEDSPVAWGGVPVADAYATPPDVANLEATFTDGQVILDWTPPDYGFLAGYSITYSVDGGPVQDLGTFGAPPVVAIGNPIFGGDYTITVRVISAWGRLSPGVSDMVAVTVTGPVEATPADVPSLYVTLGNGGQVLLAWDPVLNIARELYELRRGDAASTWSTADVLVGRFATRQATDWPPFGSWKYHIKALNAQRVYSVNAPWASADVLNYFQNPSSETITPEQAVEGDHPEVNVSASNSETVMVTDGLSSEIYRFLLSRNLPPTQIDAEMTSQGFSTLAQWDAWDLSTRRLDADVGLWGPLLPLDTDIWTGYSSLETTDQGTALRNLEHRTVPAGVTLLGISELVDDFATVQVGFEQVNNDSDSVLWGPKIYLSKNGGRRAAAFRSVTNAPRLQRMIEAALGEPIASSVVMRHHLPLGEWVLTTATTGDGLGYAEATFTSPMGTSQTPTVVAQVLADTSGDTVTVMSVSNTGFKVKTANQAGNAKNGVSVRAIAYDTGLGGTYST